MMLVVMLNNDAVLCVTFVCLFLLLARDVERAGGISALKFEFY